MGRETDARAVSDKKKVCKRKTVNGTKNVLLPSCYDRNGKPGSNVKGRRSGCCLVRVKPLSTQDDVAASLVEDYGISVYAIRGEDRDTYYAHLVSAIEHKPDITQDDGADLVSLLHKEYADTYLRNVIGGTEETTTGVIRLKSMEKDKALKFPVIAVNESQTKYLFDNRYGTGQSTIDGLLRATNILIAGKSFVVCGYGWCGKGIAMRAKGMGANVIVTEVDHIKAIEAVMDGFRVMKLEEAIRFADIVITVTGNINVVDRKHIEIANDGVIIANSGHFNVEINTGALSELAVSSKVIRDHIEEYTMKDGRRIYLLSEGRLVNLSAAEGHPAVVMDMSFANQALGAEYLAMNSSKLQPRVYVMPEEIDREIARLKLASMGITIDKLTEEQEKYLASWQSGT